MTCILGHVVILESGVSQSARTIASMMQCPLGDERRPSESCVAYIKRDVVKFGLRKNKCPSDTTDKTRPQQRDLSNHILLCRTNRDRLCSHS